MGNDAYKKTIILWTDDPDDQKTLTSIIKSLKYRPVLVKTDNAEEVLKIHCFLIFAKGSLIPSDFTDIRESALRNGELTIVFIDDSRPFPTRSSARDIIQRDISKTNEIRSLILKIALSLDRFIVRRETMKKRLSRLFYIYSLLTETGSITMEDVLYRTQIGKRTFYRDLEIIKDICTEMKIESTPGYFWNRNFKPGTKK
jgi:hypothetical protein